MAIVVGAVRELPGCKTARSGGVRIKLVVYFREAPQEVIEHRRNSVYLLEGTPHLFNRLG